MSEHQENAIALVPPQHSLIAAMAERYQLAPDKFMATVKATIFPQAATVTNEQAAAFLSVAHQYDLNPFTKEIYAFPAKGGGIVPIVSVDGWASLINRQPLLDGVEFEDQVEGGELKAITCRIYRKDRSRPVTVIEYMRECRRDTEPWKKWPARMLRHKALIQCARYAFGLSGIYDPDEAERILEATGSLPSHPKGPVIDAEAQPDPEKGAREECDKLLVGMGLNQAQREIRLSQNRGSMAAYLERVKAETAKRNGNGHPQGSPAPAHANAAPPAAPAADPPEPQSLPPQEDPLTITSDDLAVSGGRKPNGRRQGGFDF